MDNNITPKGKTPSPFVIESSHHLLNDNQTAEIIWTKPSCPVPTNPSSSYRRVGCMSDGNCLFHAILKALSPLYMKTYTIHEPIVEEHLRKLEIISQVKVEDTLLDKPRSNTDIALTYEITDPKSYIAKMTLIRHRYTMSLRQELAYKLQSTELIAKILPGSVELAKEYLLSCGFSDNETTYKQAYKSVEQQICDELLSNDNIKPDILSLMSEMLSFDFYLLRDADLLDSCLKNLPLYGGRHIHSTVVGPQDLRPSNDKTKTLPNRPAIIIISFNDYHYELIGRMDVSVNGDRKMVLFFDQTEPIVRTLYSMLLDLRKEK